MEKKSTKIEKDKRIRTIMEWLMKGYDSADIIDQCVASWSISSRQAYTYLKFAYEKFSRHEDRRVEHKKYYHLAVRRKLFRELQEKEKAHGALAALAILKEIAVMDGSYVERHDITSGGKAFQGFGFLPGELTNSQTDASDPEPETA